MTNDLSKWMEAERYDTVSFAKFYERETGDYISSQIVGKWRSGECIPHRSRRAKIEAITGGRVSGASFKRKQKEQ